ncbi:sulfated surface glycoprotein 185-like [Lycium barbarum]|uniref:sulfated surface glycoprotein 185-like n=1 Tax=Lycium barbarum TaxID=112863 RepID=UPI00293E08E9|nr:sulfated surface glycoprotein 185-like [Lycium barbarum]
MADKYSNFISVEASRSLQRFSYKELVFSQLKPAGEFKSLDRNKDGGIPTPPPPQHNLGHRWKRDVPPGPPPPPTLSPLLPAPPPPALELAPPSSPLPLPPPPASAEFLQSGVPESDELNNMLAALNHAFFVDAKSQAEKSSEEGVVIEIPIAALYEGSPSDYQIICILGVTSQH